MSYENIFIPGLSLYQAAGSDAIAKFGDRSGKNLVIIPESFLLDLERIGHAMEPTSLASRDALRYIYGEATGGPGFESEEAMWTEPTSIGDALDVVFTRHHVSQDNRTKSTSINDLVSLVHEAERQYGSQPTIITSDYADGIMLDSRKIPHERPKFLVVEADIVKRGLIEGPPELLVALYENSGSIDYEHALEIIAPDETEQTLFPNQYFSFEGNDGSPAYAKVMPHGHRNKHGYFFERTRTLDLIDQRNRDGFNVLGITPNDTEQYLALEDILLNDDIQLAFVTGGQGSGKTVLTYAAAVESIINLPGNFKNQRRFQDLSMSEFGALSKRYDQIVLFKSNDIMGGSDRGLGWLPGGEQEKKRPFMQSFIDAHERYIPDLHFPFYRMLVRNEKTEDDKGWEPLRTRSGATFKEGLPPLEDAYSAFVRGRTFARSVIIIDEAQNFTPYEVKTLIERAGQGSKLIVTGDPLQADNPRVSIEINGLTAAVKHFMDKPYSAMLHLPRNYRLQVSNDSRNWNVH